MNSYLRLFSCIFQLKNASELQLTKLSFIRPQLYRAERYKARITHILVAVNLFAYYTLLRLWQYVLHC